MAYEDDINITESLAKLAESQAFLGRMLAASIKTQEVNGNSTKVNEYQYRQQRRRNSPGLQQNIIALATGGRVISSRDDDMAGPTEGLGTHGGSVQQRQDPDGRISKSY